MKLVYELLTTLSHTDLRRLKISNLEVLSSLWKVIRCLFDNSVVGRGADELRLNEQFSTFKSDEYCGCSPAQ